MEANKLNFMRNHRIYWFFENLFIPQLSIIFPYFIFPYNFQDKYVTVKKVQKISLKHLYGQYSFLLLEHTNTGHRSLNTTKKLHHNKHMTRNQKAST